MDHCVSCGGYMASITSLEKNTHAFFSEIANDDERVFLCEWDSLPGDADGSGVVDTTDALCVLRCALHIEGDPEDFMPHCDMDGNGIIDITDALLILRKALGIK